MHHGLNNNRFQSNPELWKTCLSLEFSSSKGYAFGWMSEALDREFRLYEHDLNSSMQNLRIPEQWKVLTEESDTLISILCRSLKRYFDYLAGFLERIPNLTPAVSYASITEIESLRFPKPQIISASPDTLKYYTRVSKALLHLFSYPGLTVCRCEMDANRNISLLLFSFFDWFAILEPSRSANEAIESIRVFKRNSNPQWTTDGPVPVVFFPRRLEPTSEQRTVYETMQSYDTRNDPVPDILLPIIAAAEETLRLLLVHAISDWEERRKTDDEQFTIPDWLFIHGLVYDALRIDVYTFAPKIMECNSAGVPIRWEFACILTKPYQIEFFHARYPHKRVGSVTILLAIQRHTTRISRVLDNLKLVYPIPPIIPESGQGTEDDEAINDADINDTNDSNSDVAVLQDLEAEAAACLSECTHRTGLDSSCYGDYTSSQWSFLGDPLDAKLDSILASKTFIIGFLDNWKTGDSHKLSLPEDWFTTVFDLKKPMNSIELFEILPKSLIRMWTSRWETSFSSLTTEELRKRHFDPHSFSPDFYLSTPIRIERTLIFHDLPPVEDLYPTTTHSLEHFKDVYQYISHESDAKLAMSSPFMCTPGCWLKYDAQSRFPSPLSTDSPAVDFSLLLHPIQTVPLDMTPLTPDVNLRATILNPALVVAIQGPAAWPSEYSCSPASSHLRPKDKPEAIRRLAKAIEPSLKTHLINWQLRFEQGLVPTRDLPPWFMLFGLIYEAEEVTIVAHIPYMTDTSQYDFISCIIDTISFPPAEGSSKITEPWFLDRFRVGLALLSLQKHAFHMAGLWECVVWPYELVSWEEIVEREYLGPVLTPLERGYMIEPHPMADLYRDIHGSDETIIDHSGEVSNYEDDEEMENEHGEGEGNSEEAEAPAEEGASSTNDE